MDFRKTTIVYLYQKEEMGIVLMSPQADVCIRLGLDEGHLGLGYCLRQWSDN